MEHRLIVVGIGPGHPDYVLPAASRAIAAATVLAGGARALREFARGDQLQIKVDGDVLRLIRELRAQLVQCDIVVMVSGDPGYYSLLETLRREFPPERIQVIPGVSSFQAAFARLGLPWQNARLVSAHGRRPTDLDLAYDGNGFLSLLTDANHHPARIAGWLLERGWPGDSLVWLCRNLSYEDETVLAGTLTEIREATGFDSCVMVVKQ